MTNKILLIGLGNMGRNHLRILNTLKIEYDLRIKTCDENIETGADYTDYKEAIMEFKPESVIIATPTETHSIILEFCDGAVPKILVEKPITDSILSSKRFRGHKSQIMVGHIERYNPVITELDRQISGRKIESIIANRSGVLSERTFMNLDTDLCIHDIDVSAFLTREYPKRESCLIAKTIGPNTCNIFASINGTDCLIHADTHGPFKRREIKVIGPGFIAEADYIEQSLLLNGKTVAIDKKEPLEVELRCFLDGTYTEDSLNDAITNVATVLGE